MMQLDKCNPGLETNPIKIRRQPRCLLYRKKLHNLMKNILKYMYCFFNTCSFFLAIVLHVLAVSLPKASKCSFFLAIVLHVLAVSLPKASKCSFFLAIVLHVLAVSLSKASKCSFFLAIVLHVLAVSLSKASKKFFH